MKITPLEIRQKTFEKAFRGLDKDEVHAFLLSLSHEWERMLDENKGLKVQKKHLEKEVQKLREVESTLYKTLKTAEDTGANVVEQAHKTAELRTKETQLKTDAMLNEAESKARSTIEKAEYEARTIIEAMAREVKELEESYRIIENQRDNVVSQLKVLSVDVMGKVEKMKNQEHGIEAHVKKVKQLLRETSEKVSVRSDQSFSKMDAVRLENRKKQVTKEPKPEEGKLEDIPHPASDQEIKKNFIPKSQPITRVEAKKIPLEVSDKKTNLKEESFFDELEN